MRKINIFLMLLTSLLFSLSDAVWEAQADHTPPPTSVTIPGSLQSELGCPNDWQPDCANTHLTYDNSDDVWQGVFNLPTGNWEYKAALNNTWTENYGAGAVPDGPNIALNLGAPAPVKFYYDHKSHWVTDNVNSVIATVPGSFQDELGCPGDWQPDCLRSWLQDPDGDGIYTFTTSELPPGDYEAKVAHNESWNVNYGAGGVQDGPNIPFTVGADQTVMFSYDPLSHILEIIVEGGVGGGLEPGDELLVRPVLQHPFQDQVLYFAIPDRFNDGSDANDCGAYAGVCVEGDTQDNVLTHGFLPSDRGYYHGGDLTGLRAKLDYLENLGVTAIWVGPIYKNKPVQSDTSNLYGHSSAYHGYWILDFQQVDPHLGSNAEFEALVDEAHARGIKIFMDIITNHTADVIQLEGNSGYRNKTNFPYLDANGQPFDDSELAYYGQPDYNFPPINENSFPYNPIVPAAELNAKNPAWLNDPFLYHNRGDSGFVDENSLYGDFFGLDDLWTERQEVVEGMIDIYKYWIQTYGVDGFRIDTTKHVNREFWQKFGPDILAAAKAENIDHFFAFGEVFDQQFGHSFLSEFSTRGQLQATIDFAFQLAARDFASRSAATDNLRNFFEKDDYYTDADSNAYSQPTFLGNHDMGRIGFFLREDNSGAADSELLARSKMAHALMFFARGQPVIYYGDEQGFVGDGGDKLARQDMFPSQVAEYNDDDLIGTNETTADDNFDQTHPIYQALADYAQVYQAHVALRRGAQVHRYSTTGPGVYAFSRIERTEKIEYIVAFNNAETASQATVQTFYGAGTSFDLLTFAGAGIPAPELSTDSNSQIALTVPALGFVIYKADNPVPPNSTLPTVHISNLQNGQTVELAVENQDGHEVIQRLEVTAGLSPANLFAEVTFAVSVNGGAYEPIGTDDNPPYRVFYDVSSLPEGATLSFKAIVDDLSGHLNAAKVTGIVPSIETPTPPSETAPYAVIHYFRPDGNYGDHTTGDFNDFWGLHLWGDITETIDWTAPKPFLGQDDYGRFAWVKLAPNASNVGFIVHQGDTKDGTTADRFFNPSADGPEIWLKAGDANFYTSQAEAQGFVTIHYHRPDGVYTGWGLHLWGDAIADGVGTTWDSPRPFDSVDDFGAFWQVPLKDASQPVNFIIHKGDEKDPGPDQSMLPLESASAWIVSGDTTVYKQRGAAEDFAIIHYHRDDGDYGDPTSSNFQDFWGLHTWEGAEDPGWTTPRKPAGEDTFGIFFKVPLFDNAERVNYILHRGDTKDPGPDQSLVFNRWGYEVWQLTDEGPDPEQPHYVLPVAKISGGGGGDLTQQKAHWVSADTIAWQTSGGTANSYALHYSPDGGLAVTNGAITGGASLPLSYDPAGLSPAILAKFPYLDGFAALKLNASDLDLVPEILKGEIAVAATSNGTLADATGLQIPGVLDDLYTYNDDLGLTWEGGTPRLHLWAPTAKSVTLHLYADSDPATTSTILPMTLDPVTGVWSITGEAGWKGQYYLYEVEVFVHATGQVEHNLVTDPYSLSLAMNSTRSQIVNLEDSALAPSGWTSLAKPELDTPEDIVIYELHVRDFSANDETVPTAFRGTFKAFTVPDSNGMQHLQALAEAGLTHIHLLPVFDIATINENKSEWQIPDPALLATYPPDSEQQQAAVMAVADLDGFNWGYDPWHYTTPEGSYATNPDDTTRLLEFREMVQALNQSGLRVIMDVVYNHTSASGQDPKSVLDRIVPGYYHRLNLDGEVETSTCCQNTASEHAMMEKLMIDSVLTWAREYKVDGFRFDLMGHHSKQNMLNLRAALDSLTLAEDGVDGSKIYVYGEGWNFGEVANNARFEQATQLNLKDTGLGTFNDRLRDAVRGGGPFDGGDDLIKNQGVINGLYYDPNDLNSGSPAEKAELLLSADQIRVGLAGNLADYEFEDRNGNLVKGSEVDYNGSPAGYTGDPQEHIIYVEAHDNQTLFDHSQYKHPTDTPMAERVQAQNLGLDFTLLSQGVPFLHAGQDMLRSKSLDRNSYNSGDWFNKLDFSYQSNNWGIGLPPAPANQADWPQMGPLLADPDLNPEQSDIEAAVAHAQEMLTIRRSSKLFRLETAAEVQERLKFHNTGPNQVPGLIVMSLSDKVEPDLDPLYEMIVALFNAGDEAQTVNLPDLAGLSLSLHPQQADSTNLDGNPGDFTIPARTTLVFVEAELAPPIVISETFTFTPTELYEGLPLTLSVNFTDPNSNESHTAIVDWGDGSTPAAATVAEANGSGTISSSHTYPTPGIYSVTVTVTDENGKMGIGSTQATVLPGFLRFCLFTGGDGKTLRVDKQSSAACGLGSNGKIDLKERTVVTGDVISLNSHVDLEKEVRVNGNVAAGGEVNLKKNAQVTGNVTAAGKVSLEKGAVVNGTITQNTGVPPLGPITPVTFEVVAGTENITLEKNEARTLMPGQYGHLLVKQGATLQLKAGHYAFESVTIEKNASLHLELANGTIVIDVVHEVDIKERVRVTGAAAAENILFRVQGQQVKLDKEGTYLGTFLAPQAVIILSERASLTGALYGNEVEIKQQAQVASAPARALFVSLFMNGTLGAMEAKNIPPKTSEPEAIFLPVIIREE